MDMAYFIGLDNGGTSVKAGVYDLNGNEVAVGRAKVKQFYPHDGWIERDFDNVWNVNCEAIRKAISKAGIDPTFVKGIAVTGYGNGGVFLKKDFTPSYPRCILSGDMRAKEYVKKYTRKESIDRITSIIGQQLWAGQPVLLMNWMKDNHKDIMDETEYVLTCVDYLRLKMTGRVASELSNASCISAMNKLTRKFDSDVFEFLEISEYMHCIPDDIVGSAEIAGYLTKEAAEMTGLIEGTPVMGGIFDCAACALSCGIDNEDDLCVILGTWGINEYLDTNTVIDKELFMTSFYSIEKYCLELEGSTTAASNLQWFIDNFMQMEKIEMESQGKDVYDACEMLLKEVPYDDSSVIFLPFLYGSNVNIDAKSCFLGLNGRHTKAHMLRAVYEGIVFSHMNHIDKLKDLKKTPTTGIRMAGGGTSSDQWMQMFADALQLPLTIMETKELGAMGAAMAAAIGSGYFNDFSEAMKKFTRVWKVVMPDSAHERYYKKKYEIYNKTIAALDSVWNDFSQ